MKWLMLPVMMAAAFGLKAQCSVRSQVQTNGQVHLVAGPALLYVTKTYTLFCGARKDGKRYYFELLVRPTFFRRVKKEQVEIVLSDGTQSHLDFYDAYEIKKDSSMDILFEIDEKTLDQLIKFEIRSVSFSTDKGPKRYKLVKQKGLLRRQLNCLMREPDSH